MVYGVRGFDILLSFLIVTEITITISDSGTIEVHEYCQWDTLNVSCPHGSVLLMTSARYGRMRVGMCLSTDYHVGCSADVLNLVVGRCSGRQSCFFTVPDEALARVQPCRRDLVPYLETSHECVPVISPATNCREVTLLTAPSGFLSNSLPTSLSHHNSPPLPVLSSDYQVTNGVQCRWQIKVTEGQRVNMRLYDFTNWSQLSSAALTSVDGDVKLTASRDASCPIFAIFNDGSREGDGERREEVEREDYYLKVCSDAQRERVAYTSRNNVLQVRIPRLNEPIHFLLKYEAAGCPNILPTSETTQIRRVNNTLVVTCSNSREKWHLVCRDTTWIGDIKNCSAVAGGFLVRSRDPRQSSNDGDVYNFGLLIAVACGIVVGVMAGFVFLSVVFICRTKLQRRRGEYAEDLALESASVLLPLKHYATGATLKWAELDEIEVTRDNDVNDKCPYCLTSESVTSPRNSTSRCRCMGKVDRDLMQLLDDESQNINGELVQKKENYLNSEKTDENYIKREEEVRCSERNDFSLRGTNDSRKKLFRIRRNEIDDDDDDWPLRRRPDDDKRRSDEGKGLSDGQPKLIDERRCECDDHLL